MFEARKILVFLFVGILLFYKIRILETMKKHREDSHVFIILICGLSLLCAGTFLDTFANYLHNQYVYLTIHTCFTAGSILFIIGIILWSNLTRRIINELEEVAHLDSLTRVLNRKGILKVYEALVEKGEDFYLIICDLDGTKLINDTMGHLEGDKFICDTSQILTKFIGRKGHVSRIGGDEFLIIVVDADSQFVEKTIVSIKNKISRLYLEQDFGISIGYAAHPVDGQLFEELIEVADTRMYEDKNKHKINTSILG